jgi:rfaE bifunctional protein kinase chain/domain
MLDRYWHGEVARISPEAPVPVVHIQREENRLGGAANVALNARTLGARVSLLGVVGKDDAARSLRQLLDKHGIDAELGEDPGMETIVKLRVIARSQQMLRIDFEKEPDYEV